MNSAQSLRESMFENIIAARGRSFSTICCCRAIVCVATISCLLKRTAAFIPGIRYARLLPTPVPASASKDMSEAYACAQ